MWVQILPFQYLKVNYKSVVDWRTYTDYLRCNPSFFGHERYDYALVEEGGHHFFVHFLQFFQVSVGTQLHPLAYVETYCRCPGAMRRKDKDLGIYRLQSRATKYRIISLESVVRGALIVSDIDHPEEYIVVDTVDTDMFLRMKQLAF